MSTLSALRLKQLGRLSIGILSGVGVATYMNASMKCKDTPSSIPSNIGAYKNGLPEYSRSQVSEHSNPSERIWVTYREGVYDITDFIPKHPGGSEKIMMAAGGPLEPFWQIYQQHTGLIIQRLLEEMRIGNIKKDEPKLAQNSYDPYANEPKRPPFLKVRSMKPFNAETPMEFLPESYLTPNDLFYVRNHLPTPDVTEAEYTLEVSGVGVQDEVYFDLESVKTKFPKKCIDVAFSCAGNRRSDMSDYKPVKGLDWEAGAIGNARWCGAKLVDVLSASGYKSGARHVHFEGADLDPAGVAYAASVPVETAMDPNREVLLAYEMNGEPLPRDHGYPIRAIVPGTVAARNVKWLQRIVTSVEECQGHWQQRDYKVFPADVKWGESVPAPPIQDMPVQSAICHPPDGAVIGNAEEVTVKGYAYSGGGRDIARVEVSPDGGRTWITASLKPKDVNEDPISPWHQKEWSWRLWEAKVPLDLSRKKIDLCCKAVDVSYNTQPENVQAIWNIRGLLANSWHHVTLRRESTPTAGRIV